MILANLLAPRRATAMASRVTGGGSVANPPDWLTRLLGGYKTAAGIAVDENRALNFAATWAAVNIYTKGIRILPFVFYRRLASGGKEEAVDHPVWRLLHLRPNPEMSSSRFWSFLESCKLLWGNGYAEIERDRVGRPIGLWPIHPSRVTVKRAHELAPIVYEISGTSGTPAVTIAHTDMIHIMGLSKDGITGTSVISLARESLGLGLAAERHGSQYFGNYARPSGVLERPADQEPLSEPAAARLRASFIEKVSGDNTHLPPLLEEGLKFTEIGMPNKDAQFLETRQFQVLEVARWWGLPPHKLGHLTDATFSNIEHQQMEFVTESLTPECVDIQDEVTLKLLTDEEQLAYKAEFNLLGLLRGDHVARATHYKTMWEIGAYTINDILRLENMNPIGPAGDVHFVQLNLTTAEKVAEELGKPEADKASEDMLAFKREVVKSFLADGTTNDVMFNLTKVRDLLIDVNLPLEPGYHEPWMPVRDDAGELVSGETIEDSGGDTVGGDVLLQNEGGERTKREGGASEAMLAFRDEHSPQQLTASVGTGGQAASGTQAVGVEMMPVIVDVCERMVRKEVNAVTRAAKKYAGDATAFGVWAEKFYAEHAAAVAEALGPVTQSLARLCGVSDDEKVGKIGELLRSVAGLWCAMAREAVTACADPAAVAAWCDERVISFPASAAGGVVELVEVEL